MHVDPRSVGQSRKDRPEENEDTIEDTDTAVEDAEQEEKRQLESGEENPT
jgi:hypothetical protein